jgi:signal transduction histidine kinase
MRLALEQALIELHAAVDLMQPDSYCLVERLAGLRYRIQPALNHRGIELVWRIADGMDMQWLPEQSTVHVLKIVQEALGNILRHTHATRVEVLLEPLHRQAGLLLEVRDNGHGITVPEGHATAAMGHGLVGMRRRAQLLGGTLQILGPPAVQGTCIRLVVTPQCLPERRRRARHAPR